MSDNAETREALNLRRTADACEAWLRVWRDHRAEPSHFGSVTSSLLAALPPVAGPEVRPDETLRALTRQSCGCLTDVDGQVIVHHDGTRLAAPESVAQPCSQCGPGYRIGDDGCRHVAAAPAPAPGDEGLRAAERERIAVWLEGPCLNPDLAAKVRRLASPSPAATEVGEGER